MGIILALVLMWRSIKYDGLPANTPKRGQILAAALLAGGTSVNAGIISAEDQKGQEIPLEELKEMFW